MFNAGSITPQEVVLTVSRPYGERAASQKSTKSERAIEREQRVREQPQAIDVFVSPFLYFVEVLYSLAGLGIAIVNDFKSIEGDAALGMQSIPVAFGVDKAKWICAGTIDLTQVGVWFERERVRECVK